MVRMSLAEILRFECLTVDHLSPLLREDFSLDSLVDYLPHRNGGEVEPPWRGEKRILEVLKAEGYMFEHVRPLLVLETDGLVHKLLPDFYFPEHKLYVEYNGSEGHGNNDARYKQKNVNYDKNRVNYMIIHKKEFRDWVWLDKLKERLAQEEKGKSELVAEEDIEEMVACESELVAEDDPFDPSTVRVESNFSLIQLAAYGIAGFVFASTCCNPVNFPGRNRKAYLSGMSDSSYAYVNGFAHRDGVEKRLSGSDGLVCGKSSH